MIRIDKIDISIEAHAHDDQKNIKQFGRTLEFENGLNLIVGDNTSGKTTIVKCLFYGLGMEELIDGKFGKNGLDKSVTEKFRFNDPQKGGSDWFVTTSYVRLQLSNSSNEILTLKRNIKIDSIRENVLYVWKTPMSEDLDIADCREYYIHRRDDHDEEFGTGFYALLSSFSGMQIMKVPARNTDERTKLYMQTLFALTYIEQTRGWSDYFANIRGYNILNPKQRIIEYAMDYEFNGNIVAASNFKEQRKKIESIWSTKVEDIKSYLTYNKLFVEGLNDLVSKQIVSLDDLRFGARDFGYEIHEYITMLQKHVESLEIKRTNMQQKGIDTDYLSELKRYQEHKSAYEKFCIELASEKEKIEDISKQVESIDREIKRYTSLAEVNNIVTNMDIKECPTCHQALPFVSDQQFTVSLEQIKESKNVLNMQKKFLHPIIKKLERSVKNKGLNKLYLENQLSIEFEKVKTMAALNNVNLNPLTIGEQFELVDSKSRIAVLGSIVSHIRVVIGQLKGTKDAYDIKCKEIEALKNQDIINNPIAPQLNKFRTYLRIFGYTSDYIQKVFLKEDDSLYRYLPMVQTQENYEESIRSDSSASDFIRSIWAYYLTLLAMGPNHPGFLVMDEPCQHSIKEISLKNLFKECAQLTDKQTILFCSSQPHTEEQTQNESTSSKNTIKTLVDNLPGLNIHYQDIDPAAIVLKQ
jgi:hypothetical protein